MRTDTKKGRLSRTGVAIRVSLKEINFKVLLTVVIVCSAVIAVVYLAFGHRGATLILGWLIGPVIGLTLGLIWPTFRRGIIRARSTLEIGEYFTFRLAISAQGT